MSHEEEEVENDDDVWEGGERFDYGDLPRCRASTFEIVDDGPWAPRIALHRCAFVDDDKYDEDDNRDGNNPTTAPAETTSAILRPFEVVVLSMHV